MGDKRRAKRLPVDVPSLVETSFEYDHVNLEAVNETVEVTDISKTGIGFRSKTELPLEFYFNDKITIGNEKSFYSILKVVRKDFFEDQWNFGCEFVGRVDVLIECIDEYENRYGSSANPPRLPLAFQIFNPQISFGSACLSPAIDSPPIENPVVERNSSYSCIKRK